MAERGKRAGVCYSLGKKHFYIHQKDQLLLFYCQDVYKQSEGLLDLGF